MPWFILERTRLKRHLQPLELPNLRGEIEYDDAGEADERERGEDHSDDQQIAKACEDLELFLLLSLGEDVHRVHQRNEDPEIGNGVDSIDQRLRNKSDEEVRIKRMTSIIDSLVG